MPIQAASRQPPIISVLSQQRNTSESQSPRLVPNASLGRKIEPDSPCQASTEEPRRHQDPEAHLVRGEESLGERGLALEVGGASNVEEMENIAVEEKVAPAGLGVGDLYPGAPRVFEDGEAVAAGRG